MKKSKRAKPARQAKAAIAPSSVFPSLGVRASAGVSTAYLASIVESSQDKIISYSSDGIILSWNPAAQKLLGYSPAEIIGKPASVIVPEERRAEFERSLLTAKNGGMVAPHETLRRRKDGSVFPMELTLSPIMEGNRVIAITAIGRDISERKRAEESLRKHAELLSLAQDGARMGVFEWDLVTNRAYWTREMQELMGAELEDQPANLEPWLAAMHPDDRARLEQVFDEWMGSKQQDTTLQYRFNGNGEERWMELRGRMIRGSDGRPVKMIGTNLDISARKEAELALRQSEAKYRKLHETMREAFVSVNMKGRITEFNSAYEQMLGYSGSELRQLTYVELTPKKWRRFEARIIREKIIPDGFSGIYEKEYRRKDGSIFPVELHTFLIRDEKGEPESMWAIVRDITERKRAEHELQQSEARFRAVLESAPDAMVIVDKEGKIQLVNQQAERLFGYARKDFIGRNVEVLMPAGFRHRHVAERDGYAAAPTNRAMGKTAMTLSGRRKDGSEFPVEISLSPLETATGLLVCSVIRDITERKKAEDAIRTLNAELEDRVAARTAALQAANEALREAIDERMRLEQEVIEISEVERQRVGQDLHDDLGQQLAGLWFFAAALEKNLRAQSSPEADNAASIAGMLDKALALTRSLARGLQPVMPEPGGLMAALAELAGRSSQLFKVRCRLACRRPVLVHDPAVATHLYRIAQEAVTNAARHGHATQISIMLSSSPKELLLSVTDNGTGLEEPAHKHDGMGIRTMKYRAEALGGSLLFRSRRGGGTRVICAIPSPPAPATKQH